MATVGLAQVEMMISGSIVKDTCSCVVLQVFNSYKAVDQRASLQLSNNTQHKLCLSELFLSFDGEGGERTLKE